MATTTTLLTLCQDVAGNLDSLEQGTATGGAVSSLIAANFPFLNSAGSTSSYINSVIYISDTDDDLAPINEERIITAYAPTTGTFTPAQDFTAAPAASDTFDIYKGGISFTDVKAAVNKCLRNLRYTTISPLTLVTDGDMETSGVGTWAATNATSSKLTTGATSVLYGAQSLRVLNSAANGFAVSGAIPLIDSDTYILQARVRAVTGTANLVAYDATNSADIKSESWAKSGWGTISFTFTTPSTCKSLTIRLRNDGASDDSYWDNVILLRSNSREVPLPSWISQLDQVRRVLYDTERDEFDIDNLREVITYDLRPDTINPNWSYWVSLPHTIANAIWIEATRPFTELSAASSTTTADRYMAGLGGTVELLSTLMGRYKGDAGIPYRQDYARFLSLFRARQREIAPPRIIRPKMRFGANSPSPRFV